MNTLRHAYREMVGSESKEYLDRKRAVFKQTWKVLWRERGEGQISRSDLREREGQALRNEQKRKKGERRKEKEENRDGWRK